MATFTTLEQLSQVAQSITTKADARFRKLADKIAKTDLATELSTEISNATSGVAANAAAIALLNKTDGTAGSVKKTVDDAIAAIVADAPASLDTLKEISDWISSHSDDAAAMNSAITALQGKTVLGTHEVGGEQVEYDTVKDYVEAYVAAQQQAAELSEGNGIEITNKVISAKIDTTNANGLTAGANGLALAPATTSSAGAMSAEDKNKLDGIEVATAAQITGLIDGLWPAA